VWVMETAKERQIHPCNTFEKNCYDSRYGGRKPWADARHRRSVLIEANRIESLKISTGPSSAKSHAGGASPAFRYRLTAN
jgi:hypothetical protein